MKKYCIVIPVYKENLDPVETMCLERINYLYKDNDTQIYLVCPLSMDDKKYKSICPKLNKVPFNDKFFESTTTYSSLCMSNYFYKVFSMYEYILICQLDAFVVKNNIEEFCDLGYDYIGAPIYSPQAANWGASVENPQIGNGGFSLRKTQTFIEITDPDAEFLKSNPQFINYKHPYEDVYFCKLLPKGVLNIAPVNVCENFAVDQNCHIWHTHSNLTYPTGIHAICLNWEYWFNKIPEMNSEVIEYCSKKYSGIRIGIKNNS